MSRKPTPVVLPAELASLNERVIHCERCPRLREYCQKIAEVRRRAYADQIYWAKPAPLFGDPKARVLLVGLAPGAHGANRTGRLFTGDSSGDFLFPVLYRAGFASQPTAVSLHDGLRLKDMWMLPRCRCAPPGDKPTPEEMANCAPFLDEEISLLPRVIVMVCLGRIAYDGIVSHLIRKGLIVARKGYDFGHGVEHKLPDGRWLVGSYHPSRRNTNTGLLTEEMLQRVMDRAKVLAASFSKSGSVVK
jgi:uracil-DNA glycosylase family 4